MAQQQVIDANLMYKIGKASKADPMAKVEAEKRKAKQDRMRNYLLSAGKLAVNYWMQGQQYIGKLQAQTSPMVTDLDLAQRKAELVDNLEVQNSVKAIEQRLYNAQKTMKKLRLFPNNEKYIAAEKERNFALNYIKKLTKTTDKLALLEETYAGYFANHWGVNQSDAEFADAFSGIMNNPASIIAHNSEEEIRNAGLIASGEWRKHAFIDPETNEYMLRLNVNGDETTIRMEDFVNNVATPGDKTINELATNGIDQLIQGKTSTPYSLHSDWYETRIREMFNNPELVNENSYKTWLFTGTYTTGDGQTMTPAEYLAQQWMKNNDVGFGGKGQPGPVDIVGTEIDERTLTLKYNDETLTYLGVLQEMKNMNYGDENSRKAGMELYLNMVKNQHDKIYDYNRRQARKNTNRNPKKRTKIQLLPGQYYYPEKVAPVISAFASGNDFEEFIGDISSEYARVKRVGEDYFLKGSKDEWSDPYTLNEVTDAIGVTRIVEGLKTEDDSGGDESSDTGIVDKSEIGAYSFSWNNPKELDPED